MSLSIVTYRTQAWVLYAEIDFVMQILDEIVEIREECDTFIKFAKYEEEKAMLVDAHEEMMDKYNVVCYIYEKLALEKKDILTVTEKEIHKRMITWIESNKCVLTLLRLPYDILTHDEAMLSWEKHARDMFVKYNTNRYLEIYKIVNINSTDFIIYKNNDGEILFDLHSFSDIHGYHKPGYLVNYYGHQKKYITIYHEKYTNWDGMTILCAKARKSHNVLDSYKILQKELYSENLHKNIKLINTPQNKIIKNIKEYFGRRLTYEDQYPIKKDGILLYKIDLVIKNDSGLDVAIEIDEKHHNTEQQKRKDEIRESEIKELYDCHFVRIKYESSDNKDYLNHIRRLLN